MISETSFLCGRHRIETSRDLSRRLETTPTLFARLASLDGLYQARTPDDVKARTPDDFKSVGIPTGIRKRALPVYLEPTHQKKGKKSKWV